MLKKNLVLLYCCILLSLTTTYAQQTPGTAELPQATEPTAEAVAEGQKLFMNNCAACHKINDALIGPALAGSKERWMNLQPFNGQSGEQLFYEWVRNAPGLIEDGLPYAVQLFNDYNKQIMAPMPHLTNEDIDKLYAYVSTGGAAPATTAATPAAGAAAEGATADPQYAKGEELFKSNCASCHKPLDELIGPALQGAKERWLNLSPHNGTSGEDWFYQWVKNSQGVISEGLPYAVQLFNDYNKQVMNPFPQLSKEDIDAIMFYADNYQAPQVATTGGPGATGDAGVSDKYTGIILAVLVGLLLIIAVILGRVTRTMNRLILEKEGQPVPVAVPFYKSKKLIVTLVLALVVLTGYGLVDQAIVVGRQQGYQPDQPIAYSHKLHAGVYQIDCQYCHVGAAEGKHAVIPSPGTCMNCHNAIKKGPSAEFKEQHGLSGPANDTTEIAKIYRAVQTGEPVEWVKIHNLPDHVYFNHAQHVTAGGIECQTCHGPIQEMEVVYQHAPLSMGWCISCHRETEVKFSSNAYYEIYEKFHDQLKEGEISKVTVSDIGGTDCQRCHY